MVNHTDVLVAVEFAKIKMEAMVLMSEVLMEVTISKMQELTWVFRFLE